jgi:hypothetical protein
MEDHEDVDLILVEEPPPCKQEAAVVIFHQNEEEVTDEGEANLPLDIDLPEVVGLRGDKATDRLDGRE